MFYVIHLASDLSSVLMYIIFIIDDIIIIYKKKKCIFIGDKYFLVKKFI